MTKLKMVARQIDFNERQGKIMMKKIAGEILASGLGAITKDAKKESKKVGSFFKMILSHPIKVLASFLIAPFLLLRVAFKVENWKRKTIAIIGFLLSIILSYAAATWLGKVVGLWFIATKIGILTALGFLLGTTISVYLSLIFSIIVFNFDGLVKSQNPEIGT